MKKIIDLSKNWVVIMTLILGMSVMVSCSSNDDYDTGDLNEYEKALVGNWKSIDDDTEIMYLQLRKDRTGEWKLYYDGKFEESDSFTNWKATDKKISISYDNGVTESSTYSLSGNKLTIGDVLYQKQ